MDYENILFQSSRALSLLEVFVLQIIVLNDKYLKALYFLLKTSYFFIPIKATCAGRKGQRGVLKVDSIADTECDSFVGPGNPACVEEGANHLPFFYPPLRGGASFPIITWARAVPFPFIPNPSTTHNPAAHSIPHNDFAYLPLIFDNVDEPRGAIKKTFAIFTLLFRIFSSFAHFVFPCRPTSWLFRGAESQGYT